MIDLQGWRFYGFIAGLALLAGVAMMALLALLLPVREVLVWGGLALVPGALSAVAVMLVTKWMERRSG